MEQEMIALVLVHPISAVMVFGLVVLAAATGIYRRWYHTVLAAASAVCLLGLAIWGLVIQGGWLLRPVFQSLHSYCAAFLLLFTALCAFSGFRALHQPEPWGRRYRNQFVIVVIMLIFTIITGFFHLAEIL